MSKSLGNVLAVRELLDHVTPGALKIFLLGTHYRAPLDFSEEAIGSAGRAEHRFLNALSEIRRVQEMDLSGAASSQDDRPLLRQIRHAEREFTDAMDDDFNTPRALAAMFDLVRDINTSLRDTDRASDKAAIDSLSLAGDALRELGSVLGVLLEGRVVRRKVTDYVAAKDTVKVEVSDYIAARDAVDRASKAGQPLPEDKISLIVEYRSQRRDEQDWAAADADRAWLADRGVIVEDTPRGARWQLKSPRT